MVAVDGARQLSCDRSFSIDIEESGPLRSVIRVSGSHMETVYPTSIGYDARIFVYRNKSHIRLEWTLNNPDEFVFEQKGVGYPLPSTKHIDHLSLEFFPAQVEQLQFEGSQYSASSSVENLIGPPPSASPSDALNVAWKARKGWARVSGGKSAIQFAFHRFAEIFPKALIYQASSQSLKMEFRPERPGQSYPLVAGKQKTYEWVIGFSANDSGAAVSALARAPLVAWPEARYLNSTKVLGPGVILPSEQFTQGYSATHPFRLQSSARDNLRTRYPGIGRMGNVTSDVAGYISYGDFEYGDTVYHPDETGRLRSWNGYRGANRNLWMLFAHTGEPIDFYMAQDASNHVLDVDVKHFGIRAGQQESEFSRRVDHVTLEGSPVLIKNWADGETLAYLLTGKERHLETLKTMGRYLLQSNYVCSASELRRDRVSSVPYLNLAYLYEVEDNLSVDVEGRNRTITQCLELLTQHFQSVANSVDLSQLYQGEIAGIQRRSSFMLGYPVQAAHRYWVLSNRTSARNLVPSAARYFYHPAQVMATGAIRYTVTNQRVIPNLTLPLDQSNGLAFQLFHEKYQPAEFEMTLPALAVHDVTGDLSWLRFAAQSVDSRLTLGPPIEFPQGRFSNLLNLAGLYRTSEEALADSLKRDLLQQGVANLSVQSLQGLMEESRQASRALFESLQPAFNGQEGSLVSALAREPALQLSQSRAPVSGSRLQQMMNTLRELGGNSICALNVEVMRALARSRLRIPQAEALRATWREEWYPVAFEALNGRTFQEGWKKLLCTSSENAFHVYSGE